MAGLAAAVLAGSAACGGTVTTLESASGAGGATAAGTGTGGATASGTGSGSGTVGSGSGSGSATGSSSGSVVGSASVSSGSGAGGPGSSAVSVGSGSVSTGSGPGVVASSSSGGPVCDNQGDCGACTSCAWYGPCDAYAEDCLGNAECVAIIECYQSCNFDCNNTCWDPHPQGHADYLAVSICIYCDNCFVDCDSATFGCP